MEGLLQNLEKSFMNKLIIKEIKNNDGYIDYERG